VLGVNLRERSKIDSNLCIRVARLGINEFGMSSGEKVRASHLLVKHQGSRRPASWKDPDGKVIRKTSRDDAVAKLRDFKTQIESGQATLADLAKNDSDCSSAKRGGDLG
jgi:NIMA-interacting peptidyl-prolyl cis-trans isomerase 1